MRGTRPGHGWASGRGNCVESRGIVDKGARRGSALCTLAAALLLAAPAQAQRPTQHGGGNGPPPPSTSGDPSQPDLFPSLSLDPFSSITAPRPMEDISGEVGRLVDLESCNSWTESSVRSPTVSAKRLEVPTRAAAEYQRGCNAFKGKRWIEAEGHLRKALDSYPDYAAAWVVLGQVLVSENKDQEGKTACSKAAEVDPGYVASYLCLAEFAASESNWPEVAKFAADALAIDPIGNPYSLYYAADAGLHQNQLSQAEMHAQAAVKLDEWHHLPELHLLLAQIYQAAGNVVGEVTQLKEFLKVAANSKDAVQAKNTLALLETAPAKAPVPTAAGQPGK